MSIRYLYVTQRDEEPTTVTVLDYTGMQSSSRDVKFMVMHCSIDIIGTISRFLTKEGYIFNQSRSHHVGALIAETFKISAGGRFPVTDLYLALGPLQSEVVSKLYLRNPIDVDVKALVEKIDAVSKSIEVSDKMFGDVVRENQTLRAMLESANASVREDVVRENQILRELLDSTSTVLRTSIAHLQSRIDEIMRNNEEIQIKINGALSTSSTIRTEIASVRGLLVQSRQDAEETNTAIRDEVTKLSTMIEGLKGEVDKKAFINSAYFDEEPEEVPEKTEEIPEKTEEVPDAHPQGLWGRWF